MRLAPLLLVLTALSPLTLHADEEDGGSVPAAPRPWRTVIVEGYIGLFAGNAPADSNAVTATSQCFFCAPVTATHTVSYDSGKTEGLRTGLWLGEKRVQGGIGFELMRGKAEGDLAEANYTAFNITPMLRALLLHSERLPDLRVHGYGGLLLGTVRDGEVRVKFPEFGGTAGGPAEGSSSGVMSGVSLSYGQLVIMAEIRNLSSRLKFNYLGDSGDLKLAGKQTVVGLGWKF
ncbi:MAG: hypothetical protein Q7T36_17430 [Fluviicoccus sp.]|uniref:hypothetical protein n=1 Tax=Fluviicoccus sp. TaxID=2003552 RepID=UPI002726ACBA|nr:hypothetical protein [Fluviicoccus sp.]MDO8332251.1 hypothetical protein [Fluviicoccus sp.]